MPAPNTYASLAKYYDAIYSWKDCRKETTQLLHLIRRYKKSRGRELLDVACGTGSHLVYLRRHFRCTGTDVSPQMLAVARKKLPSLRFHRADMATLQLGRQFDIITCLFSAISSVRTEARLRQTICIDNCGAYVSQKRINREGFCVSNVTYTAQTSITSPAI